MSPLTPLNLSIPQLLSLLFHLHAPPQLLQRTMQAAVQPPPILNLASACNTLQPSLLEEKLYAMQVDHDMVAWITDYLTNRPQYVRLQSALSDVEMGNTGAPQGTVLSPFLFTTYTSDFSYNSGTCHL
ncbi:hypothetical protein SKAU_G00022990 [Synaphobranchus kaupii]|uniref:Reverse transcriptase domain-containing protein n=1 Tax=Synaphobranchus kaupii TaxID=118154 RepID=A0A9Q1JCE2_SYNKA|nr:hypothetical protein SKAU_G00022990 [Synaphobranchus kaupii]